MFAGSMGAKSLQELYDREAYSLLRMEKTNSEGEDTALVFGDDAEQLVLSNWLVLCSRSYVFGRTYLVDSFIPDHVIS